MMFDFATMGYNHKEKLLFKMSTGKITHESKILEALPFHHLYPYGHWDNNYYFFIVVKTK